MLQMENQCIHQLVLWRCFPKLPPFPLPGKHFTLAYLPELSEAAICGYDSQFEWYNSITDIKKLIYVWTCIIHLESIFFSDSLLALTCQRQDSSEQQQCDSRFWGDFLAAAIPWSTPSGSPQNLSNWCRFFPGSCPFQAVSQSSATLHKQYWVPPLPFSDVTYVTGLEWKYSSD